MSAQTGIIWIEERDIATDFTFAVTAMSGWPGNLGASPRTVPMLVGPEMNGAIVDPQTIARQPRQATISGIIMGASQAAAAVTLDALRNLVGQGEVRVRTAYATDRYCLGICTAFDGVAFNPGVLDGFISVTMTFMVKDGLAWRTTPDGLALTASRTACPIGTAPSYPVITVHGGGATFTNPTITLRNAAGDSVQTMVFTVSGGTTDVLVIDSARARISLVTAGVVADGMSLWTSGDFPILRPYDGWVETATYPTVELSFVSGTPQGAIAYTRRFV